VCLDLSGHTAKPLKAGIYEDLINEGFPVERNLLRAAVDWYISHYGYQYALRAVAKRVDLQGREVGTVTVQEQAAAQREIQRIKEMRKVSHHKPAHQREAPAKAAPPAEPVGRLTVETPQDTMRKALAMLEQAKIGFGTALVEHAGQLRANFFTAEARGLYGPLGAEIEGCLAGMERLGNALRPTSEGDSVEAPE
jgi:sRNA-binding protein